MDHETFPTREAAAKFAAMMRGWAIEIVQLYLPDAEHADGDGLAWVIQCDGDKFLRRDGYVR